MRGCILLGLLISTTVATPPLARGTDAQERLDDGGAVQRLGTSPAEVEELLSRVRDKQRRVERIRRVEYPWGLDPSSSCDERIGRLCMWHDDLKRARQPDSPRLIRERGELISALRVATASVRDNRWLTGQFVRYLVESGRLAEAREAADACLPAGDWWCLALGGYVAHSHREYERSQTRFRAALEAMPGEVRCAWSDLSDLLDGEARDRLRDSACGARDSLTRRIWWLADPLFMVAGNDRVTEHYSRHVLAEMQSGTGTPFGIGWGSDLKRILVRYGWPIRFERVVPSGLSSGVRPRIISHHHPDGRRFLPPGDYVERPDHIPADGWPLTQRAPRSEYAPSYATVESLDHQRAVFLRRDSMIVVAAFDLSRDAEMGGGLRAALVLAENERKPPTMIEGETWGQRMALAVKAPARPHLFSLEALSDAAGAARRARYGLSPRRAPPLVLNTSDLLLVQDAGYLPTTLAEAIPLTRGSTIVRAGERIGIYWEIYGIQSEGEVLTFEATVTKRGKSWLQKVGEAMGISRQDRPVSLSWQESVEASSAGTPRSMWLELPEMSPGVYVLRLQLLAFGREPRVVSREIRVDE